jgi:hypothetical protein
VAAAVLAGCSSSGHRSDAASRTSSTVPRTTTTHAGGGATTTSTTTGSTKPTTAPPTTAAPAAGTASKADFLTQANAICKSTNAKTKAVGEGLPSNPSPVDQADALDKSADLIGDGIAQMQRLTQPSGDRSDLIRFYQRSQQLLVLTRQLADAFRASNLKTVTSIETEANALDDDLTKAADAYGLSACGSGSQS